MGLLTEGTPLPWKVIKEKAEHVRKHGIKQFINQYKKSKDRQNDDFYWGDEKGLDWLLDQQDSLTLDPGYRFTPETVDCNNLNSVDVSVYNINLHYHYTLLPIKSASDSLHIKTCQLNVEYMLVKFDHNKKICQLLLKGSELLKILQQPEIQFPGNSMSIWHPEYSEFMMESSPGKPFSSQWSDLSLLEVNMNFRREEVKSLLGPNEALVTLTSFPRTGCPNFTYPPYIPQYHLGQSLLHSLFFSDDDFTSTHPRFKSFARGIKQRRKDKLTINIPIFKDKNTLSPFVEDFSQNGDDGQSQRLAKPDHIFMDAVGFGFGCCCLQTTIQASNIQEAFIMYDNLAPLCPIMLALSAAAPIFRGYLADSDCRWNVLSQSVDDRTKGERGIKPRKNKEIFIKKSRCDSINSYLCETSRCYNDLDLVYDKEIFKQLRNADVDDLLAQHIAHLFIRDPLYLFSEKIHQDDSKETDHFENIQSTNWQTLRFKPPPPNSNIGWRVEFRPMEVQLSDFENAAYVVFIVLVTRVILTFKLNFLIPISKIDENMVTAQKNDAVRKGMFYFRKDVITANSPPEAAECVGCREVIKQRIDEEYTLMSINEIINGKDDFPGLIPLVNKYLEYSECDVVTRCTVLQYLQLISNRASGKLLTMAQWIRKFVLTHADYKQDSVVNENITYDLLVECEKIASGEKPCPELFFKYSTCIRDNIPAAVPKAEANLNGHISDCT